MHFRGHDPSRHSSRAHAHPRSGPKRRSKASSEEGELDTTTPIRSPKPRRRSTQPRQAAAELDPVAGYRFRGYTIGSTNPLPCVQARPPGAHVQPCRNRPTNAKQLTGETAWEIESSSCCRLGAVTSMKEKRKMGSTERTPCAGREGGGGSEGLMVCAGATDREKSRKKSSADGWEGAGWMDKERKGRSRCPRLHAVVVVSVGIIAMDFVFFKWLHLPDAAGSCRASTDCSFFFFL